MIEIDFVVKGYPGSGRRVEDDRDLAIVNRPELVQGAFMGDMLLKIDSADFSTKFGWLTMIDLCLRLSVSVSDLANMTFRRFQLPESDDYVSFQRDGQNVVVSCSYAEGTPAALYDDLRYGVREFR